MPIEIILDPGSTHMDNWGMIEDCCETAIGIGADAIKFQFCEKDDRNQPISLDNFVHALDTYKNKIKVFASVWDVRAMSDLIHAGCPYAKLACSADRSMVQACGRNFRRVYITSDGVIDGPVDLPWVTNLWTVCVNGTAIYPVPCVPDFSGIFPRYDGYSCHSLNPRVPIYAVQAGAKVLELHMSIFKRTYCPDGRLGFTTGQLEKIIGEVNG